MAPAINFAHAATALSLLALGLNVETRFRAGELLTAQLSEPEPELTLAQLDGKLGQLEGSIASLGVRTARCEALLEPLEERKPERMIAHGDVARRSSCAQRMQWRRRQLPPRRVAEITL